MRNFVFSVDFLIGVVGDDARSLAGFVLFFGFCCDGATSAVALLRFVEKKKPKKNSHHHDGIHHPRNRWSGVVGTICPTLRKPDFLQPLGIELVHEVDAILLDGTVQDLFYLDLAMVATHHAYTFEKDDLGNFIVQDDFRENDYFEELTLYRRNILRKREALLASMIDGESRPLSAGERDVFVAMHKNCRIRTGHQHPLLSDE